MRHSRSSYAQSIWNVSIDSHDIIQGKNPYYLILFEWFLRMGFIETRGKPVCETMIHPYRPPKAHSMIHLHVNINTISCSAMQWFSIYHTNILLIFEYRKFWRRIIKNIIIISSSIFFFRICTSRYKTLI